MRSVPLRGPARIRICNANVGFLCGCAQLCFNMYTNGRMNEPLPLARPPPKDPKTGSLNQSRADPRPLNPA